MPPLDLCLVDPLLGVTLHRDHRSRSTPAAAHRRIRRLTRTVALSATGATAGLFGLIATGEHASA
ncbi:MAG: hypothetical protein QOE10_2161, partial [Gaiellales bacterium]|nr:hypothetical protein [Gaiellales bacterium]